MTDDARHAVPSLSVNRSAWPIAQRLLDSRAELAIAVSRDAMGITVIDAGIDVPGSVAAGIGVAEVCMGGLGRVQSRVDASAVWPTWIDVASAQPVLACLASQYAGWSLAASKEETGNKKFFALGSGPARSLAVKEPLFNDLRYRDNAAHACLVLEVDAPPPEIITRKVLRDCNVAPENLMVFLTPTTSLAGTTQVVARVLEVALHKAHVLGFALDDIVEGAGVAPLPPPSAEPLHAMGRTNDAILYGGRVHLTVRGSDDAARNLANGLPSINSRDYGRSFAEIFEQYERDFYRIDPALFAPAEVWVSSLASGRTWHAGRSNVALLCDLWMGESA